MGRVPAILLTVATVAFSLSVPGGLGAAAAGTTWTVTVGADSPDHAVQLLDYYPRMITVDAGDTVTFTNGATVEHTVTFLSGAKPPALAAPEPDGRVRFPSSVAFPGGGPAYDGTGVVNSGLLAGDHKSWTLTFTKPGRYTYQCLLHPAQVGTMVVQPAGTPYPKTQAQYDQLAAQARAQGLAAGAKLQSANRTAAFAGEHGTIWTASLVGDAKQRIAIYTFGTSPLTVKVGDTVRWVMKDPDEIHTVTFPGTGQVPAFIVPQPQSETPPKLYYNPAVLKPAGGADHKGNAYYNSGLLVPFNPPGPDEYSLTFTQPGTFTYWCVVHVPEGMRGTVVVTP